MKRRLFVAISFSFVGRVDKFWMELIVRLAFLALFGLCAGDWSDGHDGVDRIGGRTLAQIGTASTTACYDLCLDKEGVMIFVLVFFFSLDDIVSSLLQCILCSEPPCAFYPLPSPFLLLYFYFDHEGTFSFHSLAFIFYFKKIMLY